MSGFFAILLREINDKRAVLIAAAAASLLAFLVPFAPGFSSSSASDIREVAAVCMGIGLGWIFALFLGASMIGSDLAQGRLGFYFSRPVGGGAIWFGKLFANLFLVVATEIIVLLPAGLVAGYDANFAFPVSGGYLDFGPQDPWWALVSLLIGFPLLLLLVSHTIAVMWRARSAWVAVDIVASVVLAFYLWFQLGHLMLEAPLATVAVGVFLILALVFVLVLAGAAQVSLGRTDIQRGHRVLSFVLWGGLLAASVIATSYCVWVTSIEPQEMLTVEAVRRAPNGPWIEVAGSAAGRFDFVPRFLYNKESEAYLRLYSSWDWGDRVSFSFDGTRAAWLAPLGFLQRQLVFADLEDDQPKLQETPLTLGMAKRLCLSNRGDKVAIFEESMLSFYQLETGELLLATRWEPGRVIRMARFISDTIFRVISEDDWRVNTEPRLTRIEEINLVSGNVETIGTINPEMSDEDGVDVGGLTTWIAYDAGSQRFWLRQGSGDRWHMTIRDGRTGEIEVDLGVSSSYRNAVWSGDGRLVQGFIENGVGWIEVGPNGDGEIDRFSVGPADRLILGGESVAGEISVAVDPDSEKNRAQDCLGYSININTGVVRQVPGAVYPVSGWWGTPEGELWFGEDWTLIQWDAVSGTTKHVLGVQQKRGYEIQ